MNFSWHVYLNVARIVNEMNNEIAQINLNLETSYTEGEKLQ